MRSRPSFITTQQNFRFTFGVIIGVWLFVLIGRLWWVQGMQHQEWQQKAERNRVVRTVQRAPRGRVFDRQGRVVADNQVVYTQDQNIDGTLVENIVSQDHAVALMATAPAQINKNFSRVYPYGPVLSHIVGYIQQPFNSSDVVFGRMGVEYHYNQELTGSDGLQVFERTAGGAANRLMWQQSPQIGDDVQLALDAELSAVAFAALGNQRGAVIATHPKTGEVLALVSKPSFMPYTHLQISRADNAWLQFLDTDGEAVQENQDVAGALDSQREGVDSNMVTASWLAERGIAPTIVQAIDFPESPFLFRPIAAVYPPGSVYKVVTALAGLERSVIDANTTVLDEGELVVGDFTYQNWYWRQFGRVDGEVDVVKGLARSNDIFFYKLAEWITPESLAEFSHWFSFGEKTGIALPGEQAGIVPTPAWKQRTYGDRWYLGNTYHMGIGQGDVLVTPIQVNTMMSTVATGGRQCMPRIVKTEPAKCQEVSLSKESVSTVIRGLRAACSAGGTAYPLFDTPYDVICKTGTAEFGGEDNQGFRRTHGWLTVAASTQERQPLESEEMRPEVVVTVLIESDDNEPFKEGSRDAGSVARTVLDWWYAQESSSTEASDQEQTASETVSQEE